MQTILNYINGRHEAPRKGLYIDNYRPLDGSAFGRLPDSDAEDIDSAIKAAKAAFPSWKLSKRQERAELLWAIADRLSERLELFAEAESEDQGKPRHLARSMDIPRAIENFRFFAGAILHQSERAFHSHEGLWNYTRREPVGVAGLISPWNLPLYLLTWNRDRSDSGIFGPFRGYGCK